MPKVCSRLPVVQFAGGSGAAHLALPDLHLRQTRLWAGLSSFCLPPAESQAFGSVYPPGVEGKEGRFSAVIDSVCFFQ